VVRVYDYGRAGVERTPFLVTAPPGDTSLESLMLTRPLEPAWVLDLVAQAASALGAAHEAGLVHDHIAPGSLLLAPGGTVKLSDFLFPRDAGPVTTADPVYLAPERTRGDPATPASDLYALGVVAWECLTGKSAAREPGGGSRPLPKLPAVVGPGVAALVADLTATDPSDRLASAARAADRASGLLALPLRPADASISLSTGSQPGRIPPARGTKDLHGAGPGITGLMASPGPFGKVLLSQFGRLES
jgi:serine/threonine-protein kinase